MADCWITTHYASPVKYDLRFLNVYLNRPLASVPQIDDFVFFREGIGANQRRWLTTIADGKRLAIPAIKGSGEIFARAKVKSMRRDRNVHDPVIDYGDLDDFKWIIECHQHEFCLPISFSHLRRLLGKASNDPGRYLNLWKIPGDPSRSEIINLFDARRAPT